MRRYRLRDIVAFTNTSIETGAFPRTTAVQIEANILDHMKIWKSETIRETTLLAIVLETLCEQNGER